MPDFSKMLQRPAGEAKRPPALPQGDYPGIIKSFEFGDQNKNKTPYLRLQIGLVNWPDSAPAEDREGVDLSKRSLRKDYYLTDDALWRLDEFMRSCSITADGKTYEEVIPQLVGANVLVEVQQYLAEKTGDIGNQIGKLVGQQ